MKTAHLLLGNGGKMSDKEKLLLVLLVHDMKTQQIADTIGVSVNYVYYLSRILKARFAVDTIAALISRAIAEGFISADGKLLPQPSAGS